jgi:UPF0755 protein
MKKMKLQSDPTNTYGIWEKSHSKDSPGKIHKIDLLTDMDYNTYTVKSLPKGPICNPGLKSIESAFFPAQSSYLYFVSKNQGVHQFSPTILEHNAAVKKYQILPFEKKTNDFFKN